MFWANVIGYAVALVCLILTRRFWKGWGGRTHWIMALVMAELIAVFLLALGLGILISPNHLSTPHDAGTYGTVFTVGGCLAGGFGLLIYMRRPD